MNVKTLIKILTKEVKKCDRERANIEIWYDEQEFEIESMSGFSLSPDIIINLKPIENPVMQKATFKKEHHKMIKDKLKEIKEKN